MTVQAYKTWLFKRSQLGCSSSQNLAVQAHTTWLFKLTKLGCSSSQNLAVQAHTTWLFKLTKLGCSSSQNFAVQAHKTYFELRFTLTSRFCLLSRSFFDTSSSNHILFVCVTEQHYVSVFFTRLCPKISDI